jgi:putative aminopeptidase
MKEELKSLLKELTALNSVSGHEEAVVEFMARELAKVASNVTVDPMGNVFAVKKSGKPGPRMMVAAHSDEIGAMVKGIEPSGFVRFDKIGGTIDPLVVGRKVWVGGHFGVIGVKSGHLQTEEERSKVKKSSELYIDVGADSREEVLSMGIRPGMPVAMNSPLEFFTNPDRFCGKSVDDRIGCAILLSLMRHEEPPCGELIGVVTVQEEVGLRGAGVAARAVEPTFAIALDTMPCGDTPDIDFVREMPAGIGRGPVFQVMSGNNDTGFLVTPAIRRLLLETADVIGVPYQICTLPATNTDAAAIHLAGKGVPTGVIAIARRYSHSPVEVGDINDAVGALAILKAVVSGMRPEMDLSFIKR